MSHNARLHRDTEIFSRNEKRNKKKQTNKKKNRTSARRPNNRFPTGPERTMERSLAQGHRLLLKMPYYTYTDSGKSI